MAEWLGDRYWLAGVFYLVAFVVLAGLVMWSERR